MNEQSIITVYSIQFISFNHTNKINTLLIPLSMHEFYKLTGRKYFPLFSWNSVVKPARKKKKINKYTWITNRIEIDR